MKKSIAVIGLGQFGSQVAVSLSQKGFEVLAIDEDREEVAEIQELVPQSVILDATDEKAMRAVNVDNVDIAVVAIGSNVQSSLLCVALLQKLGIDEIYVRSIEPLQETILKSMGIVNIINIEEEMGTQLSAILASGKAGRYIHVSERHSFMEVEVPSRFVGKNLKELHVRERYNINIVGIKRYVPEVDDQGDIQYQLDMMDVPDPNYPLSDGDTLLIIGTDDHISRFLKLGDSNDR